MINKIFNDMSSKLYQMFNGADKKPPRSKEEVALANIDKETAMKILGIDSKTLGAARIISQGHEASKQWACKLLGTNLEELEEFKAFKRMPLTEKLATLFKVPRSLVEFLTAVQRCYAEHKKNDHGAWKYEDPRSHLKKAVNDVTKLPKLKDELSPEEAMDLVKLYASIVVLLYFSLFNSLHGTKQRRSQEKV